MPPAPRLISLLSTEVTGGIATRLSSEGSTNIDRKGVHVGVLLGVLVCVLLGVLVGVPLGVAP